MSCVRLPRWEQRPHHLQSNSPRRHLASLERSTIALANTAGSIATQYAYEPFGNVTASGATNANPYQFTGRENDGTGLYFYRARYYSPSFQRFISQDPVGFAGHDANLYRYASSDPVNSSDPTGWASYPPQPGDVFRRQATPCCRPAPH
jgi:RHS repeat-associated protein